MKEKYFRELAGTYYRKIYNLCLRYFGNTEDASDAVQEVFIKVWNNLDRFRGEASAGTWIYRIATNVCLSALRSAKPSLLSNTPEIPDLKSTEEDSEELGNQEIQEKKISFFNEYMKTLNPVDRSIVSLYLENFDSKIIAEITGLTDTNIRTRIHRIKTGIKKKWEENYGT